MDGEHLVCHKATFDAADDLGDESMRWHETDRKTVTCPDCAHVVRLCRGERTHHHRE